MTPDEVVIPHLAMPFRMVRGKFADLVEQDSLDDITGCVTAICRTPVGVRIEEPEIGIPDPTFEFDNTPEIIQQINEWEERATFDLIDEVVDAELHKTIRINVESTVRDQSTEGE